MLVLLRAYARYRCRVAPKCHWQFEPWSLRVGVASGRCSVPLPDLIVLAPCSPQGSLAVWVLCWRNKYRKRCSCAFWSLHAGAAAGSHSTVLLQDVHGRVRFGAWAPVALALGPLPGVAVRCLWQCALCGLGAGTAGCCCRCCCCCCPEKSLYSYMGSPPA